MRDTLVCPECTYTFGGEERFCPSCKVPLVLIPPGEPRPTELQKRARKIKPQYTEGPLVTIAGRRTQPDAELIQGILLEEGIPSMTRASMGFELPHYFPGGARDVLVPASAAQAAQELITPEGSTNVRVAPSDGLGRRLKRALALYLRMRS